MNVYKDTNDFINITQACEILGFVNYKKQIR